MTATATKAPKKVKSAKQANADAKAKKEADRKALLAAARDTIREAWAKVQDGNASALDADYEIAVTLKRVRESENYHGFTVWVEDKRNCPFSVPYAYRLLRMLKYWPHVVEERRTNPGLTTAGAMRIANAKHREANGAAQPKGKGKGKKKAKRGPAVSWSVVQVAAGEVGVTEDAALRLLASLGVHVKGLPAAAAPVVQRPTQGQK